MLAGYCQMSQRGHPGSVSVSAFLCFSGIYICHRDSETQKCGIPSEKRKIQNETLPKKKAAGKSELRLFFYRLS